MKLGKASEHFTWAEMACHDGTDVPVELEGNAVRLCGLLETIRKLFGGPLVLLSAYRTPRYNRKVGGATLSQHMKATAGDIRPIDVREVERLAAIVRANIPALPGLGGWGVYPQWIHVDVRDHRIGGHIAYWVGSGIGSEVA